MSLIKCPCGKTFEPATKDQHFCSPECEEKSKMMLAIARGEMKVNECRVCGKKFIPLSHRKQFYCSQECKETANRQKALESYHKARQKSEKELLKENHKSIVKFNEVAKNSGMNYGELQAQETINSIRPERWRKALGV